MSLKLIDFLVAEKPCACYTYKDMGAYMHMSA